MKNTNRVLYILGFVLIAAVVFALIAKKQGLIGGKSAIKVTAEESKQRSLIQTVTANGKIYPETEVKISSDVSGEIVALNYKEGQAIKKGSLIAKINADSYTTTVSQLEANYNSALANLESAKSAVTQASNSIQNTETTYNRFKSSYDKGNLSKAELDNSLAAVDAAKSQLAAAQQNVISLEYIAEAAEQAIKNAQTNLGKTLIYAPLSGIISSMNVELGEKVVGTLQMSGTEMLRIANFEDMEVRVNVSENDIIRVHLNDTAVVEVDAYPDHKFKGVVTSIASSSKGLSGGLNISTSQSTNFEVKVRILKSSYAELIEENEYPFRPGMSATTDIQTKRKDDVISVPLQAVGTRDINKDTELSEENIVEVVFVVSEEGVKQREVKTGIQNESYIEVLSGLNANEKVITAPYNAISKDLDNESSIEIVTKKELYESSK